MKLIPDPVEDPARVRARGLGRAEWGAELRGLNDKRAILSGQKTRQQAVRARTMDVPGTGPSEQINRPPQPIAAEERSLLDLLQDTSVIIPGRQSAQQHVQLELRSGGFVAVLSKEEEGRSAWDTGDLMRKIFIAENVDDVFKTASGSWQEETFEVRWLLNDNAEDPSVYSHERDEDGNVAGENVPCDSILCPVELEKMDESAGHPIWRLPDETLVRLRRLHEDALEQSAEERLAHEARQLQQLEMQREARRGAEATRTVEPSNSSSGRRRTVSQYQLEERARKRGRG